MNMILRDVVGAATETTEKDMGPPINCHRLTTEIDGSLAKVGRQTATNVSWKKELNFRRGRVGAPMNFQEDGEGTLVVIVCRRLGCVARLDISKIRGHGPRSEVRNCS